MNAKHPRQIAGAVIQSLTELTSAKLFESPLKTTAHRPTRRTLKLQRAFAPLREAYLTDNPMPSPLDTLPCEEWPAIEVAAQYAADARDAARAGNTKAAWGAASEASFWHGVAMALLRTEAAKQLAKAQAEKRRDPGRKKGGEATKKKGQEKRRQAICLYRASGKRKDCAAEEIAEKMDIPFRTARDYLKGA